MCSKILLIPLRSFVKLYRSQVVGPSSNTSHASNSLTSFEVPLLSAQEVEEQAQSLEKKMAVDFKSVAADLLCGVILM